MDPVGGASGGTGYELLLAINKKAMLDSLIEGVSLDMAHSIRQAFASTPEDRAAFNAALAKYKGMSLYPRPFDY